MTNLNDQNDHHLLKSSAAAAEEPPRNHFSVILEPFRWLKMLSSELNPTFIMGVILVYGLSQGFSGALFKVVSDYYWKDVQKVQPSVVQIYTGLYFIPWVMKPIWGILTDTFPVKGYRRRPYFVLAGVIGMVSALAVALNGNLAVVVALVCLISLSASVAIADVTIDACIARNSIEVRSLASDLQSLCGFCSSAGALLGYSASGFFVHHLGPQGSLGLLAVPPTLIILLGFVIYEQKTTGSHHYEKKHAGENVRVAIRSMYKTIKFPQVWKPSLYMCLSLALSISTHEGHFYWYTDSKAGPAFSQEFVGMIYAIGAVASIIGVLIYHKFLKDYPFRNLLFSAQLLYALSESSVRISSRLRWMPMIVLSTQLCPLGIEGTFFALLMCIDSVGALFSKWGGGVVLHLFHVTRTDFTNLWLAVLVRNMLRFAPLLLIFLVPKADQSEGLLPSDLLGKIVSGNADDESLELVPMNEKTQV
ncbi:Folate-biopterin transporter like [Quillaja saponaria]|uniref:Folate-biopterin transporter like n=1 Tax=Quillaja saponaria TaxID=32244 RepID=A0AAD7PKI1_QUISA|nr:Folate-biopterin transporter like [Quillaja saponaria]